MNNISNSSKTRKRQRDEDIEAESSRDDSTFSLEESLTFSDTLVALRIIRAQFPHIDKVSIQPFILKSQLYSSVEDRTQVDRELECSLLSLGGKVKDEHISLLINAGLLTRQLIDPNMYWFAIPNIGSVLKGLSQCGMWRWCFLLFKCQINLFILSLSIQGRKELLSLLNRRRYKEMMLAPLEKKRLRFSPLDMRFHLRDLIGSGNLKTSHAPTGLVVRVLKD
ncbi:uncharacterized protein LOC123215516 isoform X3 [Mangifera indica]|uniref:uncharacterized protein LOC123215516 isoform X3 n=1 Tax=Mangifera indica TaxID=29780 RepID=UPI001CF9ECAE|nr:uncharacterized protein LOC123215516 isoform X3 [Mangifera indica]